MRPIRVAHTNFVYRGPRPDIDDLPCTRRKPHEILSIWTFTPEERAAIAAGANLQLWLFMEPIPPVALAVTQEPEVPGAGPPTPKEPIGPKWQG